MGISPASLKVGPRRHHVAGTGNAERAIEFVTLSSVSRPGSFVFRSGGPKAVWPVPRVLMRLSAERLRERGIIKLNHFSYNGESGKAFITLREAEALSRHLEVDLEALSDAKISARRDPQTIWSIESPERPLETENGSVNPRKAWLIRGRAFFRNEGEKPEPLITWVGASGELLLFSVKIPMHSVRNTYVRVDLERKGELGFLVVDFPSGKPIFDSKGARLERILVAENGLMIHPVHFWKQPKSKSAA